MGFPGSVLLNQGDIFKATAAKIHPLGTRGYTRDGRVFRYARCGATALTPGMLIQAEAGDSSYQAQALADSTDWAAPGTNTTLFRLSTGTSMGTADAYADGYFMVTAGSTGNEVGQMLQIQSCPKTTATAGPAYCPEIFVYSEDKLVTALTTADTVTLVKNPYDKVIVQPDASQTAIPVGVCPINVTASYYFWLQTWGMAAVRVSDTWVVGRSIIVASATGTREGEAFPFSTLEGDKGAVRVGMAQYIGTDGYCGAAFITLAP